MDAREGLMITQRGHARPCEGIAIVEAPAREEGVFVRLLTGRA
ncbi:hypothetical protein LX76_04005 [Cereibacter changlensis]|uniref:Uncharacterized protein n=1 Tax=Cereibacter changlensis TaxID=402884 RepID=A0A2W7R4Q1_9RHOB|nr:hypothetical protein LX76_04005 [Cereibacter changlensis]